MLELASLAAVGLVALAVVLCGRIDALPSTRRDLLLSACGGGSVAFIFVELMPKLASAEVALASSLDRGFLGYLNHHSSLLALAGLLIFWAFERLVVVLVAGLVTSLENSPGSARGRSRTPAWSPLLYFQTLMFSAYAMLVGYLIVETAGDDFRTLPLYALAMALHFLAMGLSLKHQIGEAYDRLERWLLMAALLGGWLLALLTDAPYVRVALWNSLFAGMLIYFVVKHEVPNLSEGRFKPLFAGALGYTVLVQVMRAL
jgi:hypothetical protein